jgi:Derlin-2/3
MLMPLMMSLLYVNCKKEPDNRVNIWGFAFRSANLPWVHLVLQTLMGADFMGLLQGIVIGHLFIFLDDTLPDTHRIYLTRTPGWFKSFYNWSSVKIMRLRGQQPQFRNA